MKRIALLGIIALLATASSASAGSFEQANQQFAAGDFTAAAASYEKALADDGPNATTYFNLGNTYQNLKRYGPAILAYERARLITPRDPDLLANLTLARKAATAFDEPGRNPRLEAAIGYLSRNEWSWLVVGGALGLGALSVFGAMVNLQRRGLRNPAIACGILAGIAITAGSTALYLRRDEANRGIFLSVETAVRLSPFEKAESVGTASAGRVVRLGEKKGNFHYIEALGTNLRGWVASADVAAINSVE
jgi:tetratricopeptide (TPR) repeat protein